MTGAIYLRKSRADAEAEARGEGETLSRHQTALIALAKKHRISISNIYREIVSGDTIAARPEMQKLLSDVEQGKWDVVLVMEVERLARGDTIDQGIVAQTFKYSNTKILTPMKLYDPSNEYDEEYFEFGLFMSRREYKTINRRLQSGRLASLKEGKYIAGQAPYGYRKEKIKADKGYTLEIFEEEAKIVRQIFDWYVNGELEEDGSMRQLGCQLIAKKLNAMGIPSPSGGKWPACTVNDIIRNSTYAGEVRWGYRPNVKSVQNGVIRITRPIQKQAGYHKGIHPPIVDQETYCQAQALINSKIKTPVPKNSNLKNPLSGLIFCQKCGRSMERRKYQHGNECLMCPNPYCDTVSSILPEVETALIESLRLWLSEYKINWKLHKEKITASDSIKRKKTLIQKLEMSIETLKLQSNKLYDLLEQGVYTTEVFLERSKLLAEKIERAKAELENTKKKYATELKLISNQTELIPKVEYLLEAYHRIESASEKNRLLKEVLERVEYSKTKGGRYQESDMKLVIYPKIK